MNDIESQLIKLIEETSEAGSINRLDPEKVRRQIADYLELQAEEAFCFPELAGDPFCGMLAADYDRQKRAMFILTLFDEKHVEVAIGLGEVTEVYDFGDDYPEDESQVISEAKKHFAVSPTLRFDRARFDAWLNG